MAVAHPSLTLRLPWRPLAARYTPRIWDVAIFALVVGALTLVAFGARETFQPIAAPAAPISLDPAMLPHYALRTTLRMLAALVVSTLFTFAYGTLAAKSRRAEMVLIPLLDILQSVPVLGFATFTLAFFLALFPGRILGAELASVFLVFTAQAWNMTFSFYQSMKTVPRDLSDVSASLRLGAWRRFWTLEAPFAAPGLIWNAMLSMSGAWFVVVAGEVFSVGATHIALPGIGAYVELAIEHKDLPALGYAVVAMFVVIMLYDQLLFRPLVAWSERFRVELSAAQGPATTSWLLSFIERAQLMRRLTRPIGRMSGALMRLRFGKSPVRAPPQLASAWSSRGADGVWIVALVGVALWAAWSALVFVGAEVKWPEALGVVGFGFITLARVLVLIALASLIWVPAGIWIGLRPKWTRVIQPIAQFMASFPANILFSLFGIMIVRFHLVADIWLSPLMILGTQWYILFNVIAGASAFPNDLREAAASFRVRGWNWWRKVMLPGVAPYFVTGAITASGGSWNASVLAELVTWGGATIKAHGLGAFIAEATTKGDMPRVVLGVTVMSLFVVTFNRLLWRPLFDLASRRLRLD